MDTNTVTKSTAPAGGVIGGALAAGAHEDWIKIVGVIISALSVILPIAQSMLAMLAKRNAPKPD